MSDKTIYITALGHDALKKELEYLKKVRRAEISERIQDAKELGDLSENAEYASAREDQAFMEGRVLEIEAMLKNIQVIQGKDSDPNIVQIGDTVKTESEGKEQQYTIVGSNEANPLSGMISNESPLGRAFLGKSKGDSVTITMPRGDRVYVIKDIEPQT